MTTPPPRVLLVEDDENKRSELIRHIESWFQERGWADQKVSLARSFRSGLAAVLQQSADIVVLDMTMPTYDVGPEEDGGRPQAYAGRELLRQMDRRGICASVIVVTQFDRFGEGIHALTIDQLDAELHEAHPELYRGAVYYDIVRDGWQTRFSTLLTDAAGPHGSTTR